MENQQLTQEELLQTIADLKKQLAERPIVSAGKSFFQPSLGEQLERLDEDELLTIYQVKDAPYIIIGNALYKQLKQRSDKRYHIVRFDGSDDYLLMSDLTREALKYHIQNLQCHVTQYKNQDITPNNQDVDTDF